MIVLTAEQAAFLDRETITLGTPGLALMHNAGDAVAEAVEEMCESEETEIVVVAGKGNNGGDGFRAAAHLAGCGLQVTVLLIGNRDNVTGDALNCLREAEMAEVPIYEVVDSGELVIQRPVVLDADIVIDALFGSGLRGEIEGNAAEAVALMNASRGRIVAVDVPSGVHAGDGGVSLAAVVAERTVTFGCLKAGHVLQPGRRMCGEVTVADIGFSREVLDSIEPFGHALTQDEAAKLLPVRAWNAHKNISGRVLVVAGSAGMTGAATLSAQAAMRSGAGIVRVGCPAGMNDILETTLTEPITVPLPEVGKKRCLSLRALGEVRRLVDSADAVAVGPGLGGYFETSELVRRFVAGFSGMMVLDADGINAFSGARDVLAEARGEILLTPHAGELARLMEVPVADITG
jgi:ADP-dependent NAD(P)H-hydrate dehydratase / NAD(P)H-hydrate epimerase